ncbi:importin subunit beta-1 [Anaeramoeba flamelloides]|uniref:Importin subunit beta-1 n=1 Tax=Anaeramoeba flamelloides TaxID=1746091 RepID=A0AAV7ZI45_9EUKA|nr:importin subunit beta-1 [Anaeramoeba flamelloides]
MENTIKILSGLVDTNNITRKQSEVMMNQSIKETPLEFIASLIEIINSTTVNKTICQLSCILLKNILNELLARNFMFVIGLRSKQKFSSVPNWSKWDTKLQEKIFQVLLEMMKSSERTFLSRILTEIFAKIICLNIAHSTNENIIGDLIQMCNSQLSTNEKQNGRIIFSISLALKVLLQKDYLLTEALSLLTLSTELIRKFLQKEIKQPVLLGALSLLRGVIPKNKQLFNNPNDSEFIFQILFKLLVQVDCAEQVHRKTWKCLSSITNSCFGIIENYLDRIFDLSMDVFKSKQSEKIDTVIKFWLNLGRKEIKLIKEYNALIPNTADDLDEDLTNYIKKKLSKHKVLKKSKYIVLAIPSLLKEILEYLLESFNDVFLENIETDYEDHITNQENIFLLIEIFTKLIQDQILNLFPPEFKKKLKLNNDHISQYYVLECYNQIIPYLNKSTITRTFLNKFVVIIGNFILHKNEFLREITFIIFANIIKYHEYCLEGNEVLIKDIINTCFEILKGVENNYLNCQALRILHNFCKKSSKFEVFNKLIYTNEKKISNYLFLNFNILIITEEKQFEKLNQLIQTSTSFINLYFNNNNNNNNNHHPIQKFVIKLLNSFRSINNYYWQNCDGNFGKHIYITLIKRMISFIDVLMKKNTYFVCKNIGNIMKIIDIILNNGSKLIKGTILTTIEAISKDIENEKGNEKENEIIIEEKEDQEIVEEINEELYNIKKNENENGNDNEEFFSYDFENKNSKYIEKIYKIIQLIIPRIGNTTEMYIKNITRYLLVYLESLNPDLVYIATNFLIFLFKLKNIHIDACILDNFYDATIDALTSCELDHELKIPLIALLSILSLQLKDDIEYHLTDSLKIILTTMQLKNFENTEMVEFYNKLRLQSLYCFYTLLGIIGGKKNTLPFFEVFFPFFQEPKIWILLNKQQKVIDNLIIPKIFGKIYQIFPSQMTQILGNSDAYLNLIDNWKISKNGEILKNANIIKLF